MARLLSFVFILLCCCSVAYAQKTEKVTVSWKNHKRLYASQTADSASLFYTKLIPAGQPVGVLAILPGAFEQVPDVMNQLTLPALAVQQNILVVFPSLNQGIATFEQEHAFLDTIFRQVVRQHKVPKNQFIIGGFSGGGMVALSYTEKANQNPGNTFIIPKAVFGVDPPLDLAHLWTHAERDVARNFSEAAVNEGNWIMHLYTEALGGSPQTAPATYLKHAIYTHSEKDGGNARYLLHTPVRIYTEPAILWQMENRHRDLYDLNCTDISAMINLLQLNGNQHAEMIVTENKGVKPNGQRHPHSWSIMDSGDCLAWINQQLKK